MGFWAVAAALASGTAAYAAVDPSVLPHLVELAAVIGVFTLVCASENWT